MDEMDLLDSGSDLSELSDVESAPPTPGSSSRRSPANEPDAAPETSTLSAPHSSNKSRSTNASAKKAGLKVKLGGRRSKAADNDDSSTASPRADASSSSTPARARKIVLKPSTGTPTASSPKSEPVTKRKQSSRRRTPSAKLTDELKDLGDVENSKDDLARMFDDEEEPADDGETNHSGDDFEPEEKSGIKAGGQRAALKRTRSTRQDGKRSAVGSVTAPEEEEEDLAPRRKKRSRPSTYVSDPDDGDHKTGNPSGVVSSDDESMKDVGTEDESDEADGNEEDDDEVVGGRRKAGARGSKKATTKTTAAGAQKKGGARSSLAGAAGTTPTGLKKAGAAASTGASSKTLSFADKMRASIDSAKDKTIKPPSTSASKLNPTASAFRPGARPGASTPGAAASAGTGAGTGSKRPSSQAFGKSMSGWDQLFGGVSGLSASAQSTPSKSTPSKTAAAANSKSASSSSSTGGAGSSNASGGAGGPGTSGIRPDPTMETLTAEELAEARATRNREYLDTDQCFDLLAHAEIMLAFEQDIIFRDRQTARMLRPSHWRAGFKFASSSSESAAAKAPSNGVGGSSSESTRSGATATAV
ncbi:hypothetical protein BCV70DRAFT_218735 [Testicularia cyperi]|uniref:Uncharacterized protein n=1 Tax=Testicularia cyperi TaxID=1882483 RepID=A0A317XLU2_9BASI|nr:hypothetical protein BCV70DRAFT_218735 [Testicularia cyperi]